MQRILLSLMLLTSTLMVTTSTQCGPISGAIAYWLTKGTCFGTMAVVTATAGASTAGAGAAAAATAIPAAVAATETASLSVAAFFLAIPFLP